MEVHIDKANGYSTVYNQCIGKTLSLNYSHFGIGLRRYLQRCGENLYLQFSGRNAEASATAPFFDTAQAERPGKDRGSLAHRDAEAQSRPRTNAESLTRTPLRNT